MALHGFPTRLKLIPSGISSNGFGSKMPRLVTTMSDPFRWGVTAERQDPTRGSPRETLVHMTAGTSVAQRGFFVSALVVAVASCSGGSQQPTQAAATPPPASFVNKVWRVESSSSGSETGGLYVFLSDGTLLISSPHGTPSLGKWKQDAGGLTMIEEGLSYKVNVLKLSADEFRIMINNPGSAVEIGFAPADKPAAASSVPASR